MTFHRIGHRQPCAVQDFHAGPLDTGRRGWPIPQMWGFLFRYHRHPLRMPVGRASIPDVGPSCPDDFRIPPAPDRVRSKRRTSGKSHVCPAFRRRWVLPSYAPRLLTKPPCRAVGTFSGRAYNDQRQSRAHNVFEKCGTLSCRSDATQKADKKSLASCPLFSCFLFC